MSWARAWADRIAKSENLAEEIEKAIAISFGEGCEQTIEIYERRNDKSKNRIAFNGELLKN